MNARRETRRALELILKLAGRLATDKFPPPEILRLPLAAAIS
jgi:hypothetical protein